MFLVFYLHQKNVLSVKYYFFLQNLSFLRRLLTIKTLFQFETLKISQFKSSFRLQINAA